MKTWFFLNNSFLRSTRDSYRTCKKIGDYTVNALLSHNSDATINTLHLAFKPFVTTFNNAYAAWINQLGSQKSLTNDLMFNLKLLQSSKIKTWDVAIQNIHAEGSTKYISLLPNKRIPFQNGSQEDRIAACEALSLALTGLTALATTKTDVDAFIITLKTSFNIQKGSKSNTNGSSNSVEAARIAVCNELYGVLGILMSKYKSNPNEAAQYFDLQSIRNREQTLFKGTLHIGETKFVMTHTFEPNDQIRLMNKGETTLRFALCKEANDPIGTLFVDVPSNDETVVLVTQLGLPNYRFLKVQNMSEVAGNKYTVMHL